jgi:hypothetical protein
MADKFPANTTFKANTGDIGAFVRGFLVHLENEGEDAAVLHGWENGFSGTLSDVDLVISNSAFRKVTILVSGYAASTGWRLCQVLRHESTAAFCVCSWSGDPGRVVALDICSDYIRNERLLIGADELLASRERLPWGGFRLRSVMELRYRFVKAAVKAKAASKLAETFRAYQDSNRLELEKWLKERWGIKHANWDEAGLSSTWKQLEVLTRNAKVSGRISGWKRIFSRIIHPSGLVVIRMTPGQDQAVARCFGRLYFRRQLLVDRFSLTMNKSMVTSTLIRCRQMGKVWRHLLSQNLWMEAGENETPDELVERITIHLQDRCARRERI